MPLQYLLLEVTVLLHLLQAHQLQEQAAVVAELAKTQELKQDLAELVVEVQELIGTALHLLLHQVLRMEQ
jgi:hypothetical protein